MLVSTKRRNRKKNNIKYMLTLLRCLLASTIEQKPKVYGVQYNPAKILKHVYIFSSQIKI